MVMHRRTLLEHGSMLVGVAHDVRVAHVKAMYERAMIGDAGHARRGVEGVAMGVAGPGVGQPGSQTCT